MSTPDNRDDADRHNAEFMDRFGYSPSNTPLPIRALARAWAALGRAKLRISLWLVRRSSDSLADSPGCHPERPVPRSLGEARSEGPRR